MNTAVLWSRIGLVLLAIGVVGAPHSTETVVNAQPARASLQPTTIARAVRAGVTPRVRDLRPEPLKASERDPGQIKGKAPREIRNRPLPRSERAAQGLAPAPTGDAAAQRVAPQAAMPSPLLSFEGLSNEDNVDQFGFGVLPPDTVGDVGPNHYVQAVNIVYRVFDKKGVPQTPPFKMSQLFQNIGGVCATRDDGDPIVLYDHLANRWLLTQLAAATPISHQCIAVSATGDPAGAYFAYDFAMPNEKFNDYPKFGVWPDAYYMTDNQFTTSFVGGGVFAFDRTRMLQGNPDASFIYFDLELLDPTIGGMLPTDLDGAPPPAGTPNYFVYFTATEFGDANDALRIFELRASFDEPETSTFAERADSPLVVADFDPLSPAGADDVEQPAPADVQTESLDAISDRLMHRLVYRRFGSHESLVVNHTVNVGTGTTIDTHQAGVRYYELRRALPNGAFEVHEQASFAPDADNRWMGSAAIDNQGNLAVGYSVSSRQTFPSIRYAGRLAFDPPGGLTQGETQLQAGSFVQRDTRSRWGDYSSLNVDPANECTFWYTNQYYAVDNPTSVAEWQTRVGSFRFAACTPPARGGVSGTVTNCTGGGNVAGALVEVGAYSRVTGGNGRFSMRLPPGTYALIVTPPSGYAAPPPEDVTVEADGTLTANVCLTGVPLIELADAALVGEGCAPENGAVDPGEFVIVDITLRNTGFAPTANLEGRLLENATVKRPSGARRYGAIPPGGEATQRYNWRASGLCGEPYLLQLLVADGSTSFGTFEATELLGAITEHTFSNEIPIELPPDPPAAGPAAPYPSTIDVSDITEPVQKITVTLHGLAHTFPDDIDLLLVGPQGQSVVLLSDVGGPDDISGVDLTFDDEAQTPAPVPIVSGTFQPTNIGTDDTFEAPAPEGPYGAALSAFKVADPNGTWSLYTVDDVESDTGMIAGGWTLTVTTLSCTAQCGNVRPRLRVDATLRRASPTAVMAEILVNNAGNGVAQAVEITSVTLGAETGSPLPQRLGNILPGNTGTAHVAFDPSPPQGGRVELRVKGSSLEGPFEATLRRVVP
ncbi:MAG: carboxypeptidase-like regulatory domain-containing protein [Vicinamibacteraceae bacterium]